MNSCIELLNRLGDAVLRFAWPMLWQSSLLITVLFALDFALRRKVRAAVRYALWLVVLLKLLVPPSLALPTGLAWWVRPAAPAPQVFQAKPFVVTYSPALIPPPENLPVVQPPPPPVPRLSAAAAALLASIVISLGLFGWMLWRWRQVVRHIRRTEAPPDWLHDLLVVTKLQAGLRGRIRLQLTDQAISPAVCGLFRPLVMLPASLTEQLPRPQLRAVLLHELVHLRRADVWVNCAQALLQIAYWWHPLLWLANARIRRLREEAVDDAVMLSLREEAEIYAPTLLEVAKLAFHRPLASLGLVGILESKRALRQRIERLLDFQPPRRAGLTMVSMLGILAFSCLAVPQGEAPTKPTKAAADAENGVVVVDANSATLDTKIEEAQVENRQEFLAKQPISPDFKTAEPDPPVRAEPKAKAAALVQEAVVLFELHKSDEAGAKLNEAIKLDPSNQQAYYYVNLIQEARYLEAQNKGGSPDGPNSFARRIPVNRSKSRQAIFQKLDRIRLDGVRFDNVPLSEVVRFLSVECKKQDVDKIGLNFILSPNINAGSETIVDPATGLPRAPAPPLPEVQDIGTIQIKLAPALTSVRLMDVLDIIVKAADQPPGTFGIKYSIEDYGVIFSWKPRETVELMLRTFRVVPNTFVQALESATGYAVGTGMPNPLNADSNGGQSRYYHDPNNPPGVMSLARTNDTAAVAWACRAFFQSRGVNLDPPKNVFWDNRTGILLVNATMKDLDVIEREVQLLSISTQTGLNSDRTTNVISTVAEPALSKAITPGVGASSFKNGVNDSIRLQVNFAPKAVSGSVQLIVGVTWNRGAITPSNSNLIACRALIPNGCALVIDCPQAKAAAGKNYWFSFSPIIQEPNAKPPKR